MLKSNQTLFKEGDPSDGMYLLRSGTLEVCLEKDEKTVILATIESGGMIGEMALFDQKPRSATVRAKGDAEVTLISNADFKGLMKQIPKWFTALMGTLSARLRATNQQLQDLTGRLDSMNTAGASGKKTKMLELLKVLYVTDLVFQKDGKREGGGNGKDSANKVFMVKKTTVLEVLGEIFFVSEKNLEAVFDKLKETKLLYEKTENKTEVFLCLENKYKLGRFNTYLKSHLKSSAISFLPQEGIEMLLTIEQFSQKSAYETFTVSLDELKAEGANLGYQSSDKWDAFLPDLAVIHEDLRGIKSSAGKIGFRIRRKILKDLVFFHSNITALGTTPWTAH